jgi:hypothetical protein
MINFEWDTEKNKANIKKHGVAFEMAAKVFLDEKRIERYDAEHSSINESRYKTIGMVGKVLTVIYTERKTAIRIISARLAEKEEIDEYYKDYELR